MSATIEQAPAFVTTDAMVHQVLPQHDPAAALAAAEAYARQRVKLGDTLQAMRDRGRITGPELRAGHEIAMVVAWTEGDCRPLVRSQFSERLAASTGGGSVEVAMLDAETLRYGPWRAWASTYPVNRAGATLEALTRLAAVEGLGIRQCRQRLRMENTRVWKLLRRSLHHYASLGGWATGPNPEPLAFESMEGA